MYSDSERIAQRLERLEQEEQRTKVQIQQERRRSRVQIGLALCAVACAIFLSPAGQKAVADSGTGLEARVTALEQKVAQLQTASGSQTAQIAALQQALNQEVSDR